MIKNEKQGHQDIYAWLKEKENAFLHLVFNNQEGKSLKMMKEQWREDKMKLNEKFFDNNFVKGIHKPELPSFKNNADVLLGIDTDCE